jgi:hypothetical protein
LKKQLSSSLLIALSGTCVVCLRVQSLRQNATQQ